MLTHLRVILAIRPSPPAAPVQHPQVDALGEEQRALEESVALRESILESRRAIAGGSAPWDDDPASSKASVGGGSGAGGVALGGGYNRAQSFAAKNRLNAIAKAQEGELKALRAELEVMQRKSFPSFPAASGGGAGGGH